MENLDNNDLIEKYLGGALSPEDQQAVETSLITDPAFRAEVELHRHLHEEFVDPKKLQLRDLLTEVLKESQPPPPINYGWLKWPGILFGLLLLGGLGWYWLATSRESAQPDTQEEFKSTPHTQEPIATQEKDNPTNEVIEKTPERPIAKADPEAYIPNRDFENRLGSMIRSSDGTATITSPAIGSTFKAENGAVKINFRGTAPADADTTQFPFVLKIYDNRAVLGKELFRSLPIITNRNAANGTWAFSSVQRIPLRPGLYYFTLERQVDEDLILVGKFRVE